jgi:hypothetical protein
VSARCDNILSSRGPCNEVLTVSTNGQGVVTTRCKRCEAREQGRCWNCGKPRTNCLTRGVFCKACGYAANRMSQKRYHQSPEGKEARQRVDAKRLKDPEVRAKRRAYLKAWKAKNPEKVAAAWQRYKVTRLAA